MPLLEDVTPSTGLGQIGASVPVELFWAIHLLRDDTSYTHNPVLDSAPPALTERLRRIWPGEQPDCFGELLIIAEHQGMLFSTDAAEVLRRLRESVHVDPEMRLASETPEDRVRLLERCALLEKDAGFRARYADVVAEVWKLIEGEWETAGRAAAEAAASQLRRAAASGPPMVELVTARAPHCAREPWQSQAVTAEHAGRVSVATAFFGGKFLAWDFPSTYLLGVQAEAAGDLTVLRREAHQVASRLKVLADPTRLAILISLSRQPATVTEIARAFSLAQPTVSAHLKLLRDGGLVDGGREDGRPDYSADRRAVGLLLREVEHQLADPAA
jgi:ArsR family transcriptional regulator